MRPLVLVVFILFGSLCVPADASDAIADAEFARLQAEFQFALDELRTVHQFPGATAAFILPDGRYAAAATGLADVEREIPMGVDSRLFSGSIGKTFVAALTLLMVRDGDLDLDAPIDTWLGDEDWFPKLQNGDRILLRHLLSHTSGMHDHVNSGGFAFAIGQRMQMKLDDKPFTPRELINFVVRKDPLFEPGEGFSYTDTGYILIGLIVEKVAGRPFFDLVEERLLVPHALTLTTPANRRRIPGLVPGYLHPENPFGLPGTSMPEPGLLLFHPQTEWTGGGLISNPKDLVRWAHILYRDDLVGPELSRRMIDTGFQAPAANGHYGFGVYVQPSKYGQTLGHGGVYPGYNSMLTYYADHEFAVAIQINRDFDNPRGAYIQKLAAPIAAGLGID